MEYQADVTNLTGNELNQLVAEKIKAGWSLLKIEPQCHVFLIFNNFNSAAINIIDVTELKDLDFTRIVKNKIKDGWHIVKVEPRIGLFMIFHKKR